MLRRLLDELSADHREAFKDLLIERNIVEDLTAIVAADLLEDHESEELHRWLVRFYGDALDQLLLELEQQSKKDQRQNLLFIIENLDTLPAEQVRTHFFYNGTSRAMEYAVQWTVIRIDNLLAGYTGILDSGSIVWNFKQTPERMRLLVLQKIDRGDAPDIATALMQKLQPEDYARLQKLNLRLPTNHHVKSTLDRSVEAGEWGVIAVETIAGGMVGIVHGGVSFAWDIFQGIVDIPTGIYHAFMTLLFLSSKGSVGSDSVLKLSECIQSVEGFVGDPLAVLEQAYEQTMLESEAFEGPMEAFQRAEYWGRLTTKFLITIVVIVKGIQTAAKGISGKKIPVIKRTGRIDKEMDVILENVRKGEKEPEPIVEIGPEMTLRAEGDKQLGKLMNQLYKARRRVMAPGIDKNQLMKLTKKEIDELIGYFKIRRVLEKDIDDFTLGELSTWTGVEWAAIKRDTGFTWLKTDGEWGEVKIPIDRSIIEVRHTHPVGSSIEKSLAASRTDYETFRALVEDEGAEVRLFRIIAGGHTKDYTLNALKEKFNK